jgi:membrane-associated phospholipid phosphatase
VTTSIVERLRKGVPTDQLRSPFQPLSLPAYALVAAEIVAAGILLFATGFTVRVDALLLFPFWAMLLCAAAMLLRRYGHDRVSGCMETVGLVYGQGLAILFLLFPLAALSGPLADGHLAAADRSLGFDWVNFAAPFARHKTVQTVVALVYASFNWQPLLVLVVLFIQGEEYRAWRLAFAAALSAFLTAMLFPFTPALGTFRYFHINPLDFSNFGAPWNFGRALLDIKGGTRAITPRLFTGLVSFPSYHAAAAAIFAWSMWPFKRWRTPFLLLNFGMSASALLMGAHYLVDLLAGAALGIGSILISGLALQRLRFDDQASVLPDSPLPTRPRTKTPLVFD